MKSGSQFPVLRSVRQTETEVCENGKLHKNIYTERDGTP